MQWWYRLFPPRYSVETFNGRYYPKYYKKYIKIYGNKYVHDFYFTECATSKDSLEEAKDVCELHRIEQLKEKLRTPKDKLVFWKESDDYIQYW